MSFEPVVSRKLLLILAIGALFALVNACDASFKSEDGNSKVNGSIHVPVGRAPADVKTVNGSIRVDANATIDDATTVNGSVDLGAHAKGARLQTVNGGISLDEGAQATELKSVNGALNLRPGAELSGSLTNVNGNIFVTAAHVGGMIHTEAGDITLSGATRVDRGIVIEKPYRSVFGSDPTIIIGPGVTVGGDLKFERKVRLFVSDKATIGSVSGATAITFSGDKPPNAT